MQTIFEFLGINAMNPIGAYSVLFLIVLEAIFFGIGIVHFMWSLFKEYEPNALTDGLDGMFAGPDLEDRMAGLTFIVLFWLIHPILGIIQIADYVKERRQAKVLVIV